MNSSFMLENKVAIVTGGGTGIGFSIATEMARAGANIVVASRKMEHLEKAVKQVTALGKQCLAVPVDLRKPEDIDNLVLMTVEKFGRIDILVNNAGVYFTSLPFEDASINALDVVINIDLRGTLLTCRAVGKVMIKQQKGNIINIASDAGVFGDPEAGAYGPAKAGVINLTKQLAVEWAKHNIRVNCIAPGMILTEGANEWLEAGKLPKTPPNASKRWGQPVEIANAVLFLASEASSLVVGQTICVDGGVFPSAKG